LLEERVFAASGLDPGPKNVLDQRLDIAPTGGRDNANAPAVGKAVERGIGKALDVVANLFESLFAPPLTPEQKRGAAIKAEERQAEEQKDYANYAIELAETQRKQEEQRQAAQRREDERKRQQDRDR
jgi:hypothetical protein